MKLAIFVRAPEVWGAERSLLTLLNSQAAKAHTIDVYVGDGSPLTSELNRLEVNWHPFSFVNHRSLTAGGLRKASLGSIVGDLFRISAKGIKSSRLIRQYDAILTFGLWETPEIAFAGRLSRTPVIFDFHVTFSGRIGRAAIAGITRLVNGVIAPSKATYSQAGIKTLSDRLHVVARPVALSLPIPVSTEPRSTSKLLVGIFGQVDERKRVLEVIETLEPLSHAVDLVVVGARPQALQTEYERNISSAIQDVGEGWRLVERSNDVSELMATCDVVLNTSRHEAFGRTVVEAAGLGALPVVMNGGGPEEIVRDMGRGVVVVNWPDLSDTIANLSARLRGGSSVRLTPRESELARRRYSPDAIAEQYFATVEALSTRRNGRIANRPTS